MVLFPVQVCVRPGAGVLFSKFLSVNDLSATLADIYNTKVVGRLDEREAALAGDLVPIKIKVGDFEAEPESIYNELGNYTDLSGGQFKLIITNIYL
jgi:hypothetical protein